MTEREKRHETAFSDDKETSITELFLFWRCVAKMSKNVAIGPLAQPRPKNGDENNVTNHQALPKPKISDENKHHKLLPRRISIRHRLNRYVTIRSAWVPIWKASCRPIYLLAQPILGTLFSFSL